MNPKYCGEPKQVLRLGVKGIVVSFYLISCYMQLTYV